MPSEVFIITTAGLINAIINLKYNINSIEFSIYLQLIVLNLSRLVRVLL